MCALAVYLFDKFSVHSGVEILDGSYTGKVRELLCYLLLHRDHPHPREALADLLWDEDPTPQSRKHLRQVLWQMQTTLHAQLGTAADHLLRIEPEWVQLSESTDLWLDVAAFERAVSTVQGVSGRDLDADAAQTLQDATTLYRGDVLAGWYQDWCLYERERLQNMFLSALDKLMAYCEAQHAYESGFACGARILRFDSAHERTHQRLMRLYYLSGDRTAALRQYERCATALDVELGVKPSRRTVALYTQIQADEIDAAIWPTPSVGPSEVVMVSPLHDLLDRLQRLQTVVDTVRDLVRQDIEAAKLALVGFKSGSSDRP